MVSTFKPPTARRYAISPIVVKEPSSNLCSNLLWSRISRKSVGKIPLGLSFSNILSLVIVIVIVTTCSAVLASGMCVHDSSVCCFPTIVMILVLPRELMNTANTQKRENHRIVIMENGAAVGFDGASRLTRPLARMPPFLHQL